MGTGTCLNDMGNLVYYNITLQILECSCVTTVFQEDLEKDKYLSHSRHPEEPKYEKSLFSQIHAFFDTDASKPIVTSERQIDVKERLAESCHSIRNYSLKIVPADVLKSSLGLSLLFGVFFFILIVLILVCLKKKKAKEKNVDHAVVESNTIKNELKERSVEPVKPTSASVLNIEKQTDLSGNKLKYNQNELVKLVYQLCISDSSQGKLNVAEFLDRTGDKLFAKLDKKLIPAPSPGPLSQSLLATATPRLARRAIHHRQRIGSSPALQLFDTESSPSALNNASSSEWKMFKQFHRQMAWKEPMYPNVNDASLNLVDQQLLRYFQRVCPVSFDTWTCSVMITNYALLLLKMELNNLVTSKGYRFIDMVPSGSAAKGTKVGKSNQFDILMILQPSVLPCGVVHMDRQGRIPPGQVLINAETDKPTDLVKQGTLCKLDVADSESPYYMSGREFYYATEELIDMCLQGLYTKTRTQMDRLPFKINRTTSSKLSINLDTKNIVGFGLTDIKIAIYPVMLLPMEGWFQDIPVYVMPQPISYGDEQGSNSKKSAIPPDFLWSLNFSEVHSAYLRSIDLKMKHAGVNSCHTTLLMILKSLLTGSNRNNLLDRGELLTTHISHTINFLLLESSPQQWTFDHLADRFSDIVNFLQDAFQNERLPNFFLNNPHLVKKVPFVANNPVFMCSRQQNILSDVPNKEKCLEYIEKCLRESGLKGCHKEGYAADMWEYEFFVY